LSQLSNATGGGQANSLAETQVFKGVWALPLTVVIRFPSVQNAKAWHDDREHIGLAKFRHGTACKN